MTWLFAAVDGAQPWHIAVGAIALLLACMWCDSRTGKP